MERKTFNNEYIEFTTGWSGFDIKYHVAGYFNPYASIQIYMIWGMLFLTLPWKHHKKVKIEKTSQEIRKDKLKKISDPNFKVENRYKKVEYDGSQSPTYGFYFHDRTFGVCYGKKKKLYDLPWMQDWIRTSCLKKDGEWAHETTKNINMDFWDKNKWKNILFEEEHPYKYVCKDGTIQNRIATINVIEREWRWKWFKWLKYTKFVRKVIDINFDKEVGERSGSWKGGCTGCSYDMLPNETPHQTLKRMEKERKFL